VARNKHIESRDLGLELGLLLARYVINTENLHYGYWPDDLPVKLQNLPRAQEHYSDLLVSHVPADARSVLDVGCGAGLLAERLVTRGQEVECVAPESGLLDCARKRLGDRAKVHAGLFEDFEPGRKFDVVMFSESFQYVPLDEGLPHALSMLNPGGHVVICDFFKVQGKRNSPIGGGHRYQKFERMLVEQGVQVVTNLDITPRTAPTITLVNEFMQMVGSPGYNLLVDHCMREWSLMTRTIRWFFRKKLAKVEHKYFSGVRTAQAFNEYKTYRLVVLRAAGVAESASPAPPLQIGATA
jgi:2-polyprenyl-3-methyl-5-hydroxy-6-metoxy-1,4-benzoquinol methylase